MSDVAPSRTVAGLTPRATNTPDLSRLVRANRTAEPQIEVIPRSEEPAAARQAEETAQPKAISRPARTPRKRNAARPPEIAAADEESYRMTTYLHSSNRDRARAAYRATSHLEGDKSWSDFVERAILAETVRREAAHNAGERYQGDSSPLPAGRPLG
jgi:hypothetical protein